MMTKFGSIASLLALAISSAPASAADWRSVPFDTGSHAVAARPFMFSGATLRLNLDKRAEHRPELALRVTGATGASALGMRIGDGLAFSLAPGSKPCLTLNGVDGRQLGKRLGMSGGAKAALIVGGVVLIGAAVAVAASGWGDAPAAIFDDDE